MHHHDKDEHSDFNGFGGSYTVGPWTMERTSSGGLEFLHADYECPAEEAPCFICVPGDSPSAVVFVNRSLIETPADLAIINDIIEAYNAMYAFNKLMVDE